MFSFKRFSTYKSTLEQKDPSSKSLYYKNVHDQTVYIKIISYFKSSNYEGTNKS